MSARKLVLSCLLLVTSLFVTPLSTLAASSDEPTSSLSAATNYQLPTTIPPTSPLYTDLMVNNLFHTFSCLAVGQSFIGQPCLTYQMTKNAQGMLQGVPVLSQTNLSGGVLGATGSLITALYQNPPVRTADYLASVGSGLGIVKEAQAQTVGGSGEGVLHPILTLWQVSRNISYVALIIIFLVIGLMVMFRNKLNPQTVITAQAALPGLVIGLILITFSYFLAGLISDMAFGGTNIVGYYFSAAQGNPPQNLIADIKNKNVISISSSFTGIIDNETATAFIDSIWMQLSDSARFLLTVLTIFVTAQTTSQAAEAFKAIPGYGQIIQAVVNIGAGVLAATNQTFIIGMALALIATAILLYSMFKLLIRLLTSYITIIFLTMTAPFQFLAASLPGRQGVATAWMLNMLANVLAFPAVLAAFYFVAFLLPSGTINNVNKSIDPTCEADAKNCLFKVSQLNQTDHGFITPAYATFNGGTVSIVGSQTFPLFGGMKLDFINLLLAFGTLIAIPSIPDIITRTIGKAGPAGQILGQEISGAVGQGRGYAGQFQRGVGGISGQVASARGLFQTPSYESVPGEDGKLTYRVSKYSYQPGGLRKFGQWMTRKSKKGGGGSGDVTSEEDVAGGVQQGPEREV